MSFDFKKYLQENKLGPYSKDMTSEVKKDMKESGEVFEEPQDDIEGDFQDETEFAEKDFDYDNEQFPDANERIMGLGGDRLLKIVKYLTDEGFELEDIFDFIASMHGNEDSELNESEVQCIEKGGEYYKVDDEHNIISGPYTDDRCTRSANYDPRDNSTPQSRRSFSYPLKPKRRF